VEPRQALVETSEQYDPRQAAQRPSRIPAVATYAAVDDCTLEIVTKHRMQRCTSACLDIDVL
jgi:hypothetical protein